MRKLEGHTFCPGFLSAALVLFNTLAGLESAEVRFGLMSCGFGREKIRETVGFGGGDLRSYRFFRPVVR